MFASLVGSKKVMMGLILRPLIPPLLLISFTKRLIALPCSVYSTSPANPSSAESACRFTTGNTTLISVAVTPRALVLALVTGVGPDDACAGTDTPKPMVPTITAHAPEILNLFRPITSPFVCAFSPQEHAASADPVQLAISTLEDQVEQVTRIPTTDPAAADTDR